MDTGTIVAIIMGGLAMLGFFLNLFKMSRDSGKFLTKESHDKVCRDRLTLIRAETKVAVLEAMNQWLRENGHKLR